LKYFALVVALAWPAHSANVFESGNDLLTACLGDGQQRMFCYGYIEAVADTMKYFRQVGVPECPPSYAIARQVRDVVVNSLIAHPADRHYTAVSLAIDAFKAAWGCE
jgi:Rap1a immunity proteins